MHAGNKDEFRFKVGTAVLDSTAADGMPCVTEINRHA
jgi:hypothetical protein